MSRILAERVISAYPVSVATSLALESLFPTTAPSIDPDRIKPPAVDMSPFRQFYVNIDTLFRNIIGACKRDDIPRLHPLEIAECIAQELELIESLLFNEGRGQCKLVPYISKYEFNNKDYPHAIFKGVSTDSQKQYAQMLIATQQSIQRNHLVKDLMNFKCKLTGSSLSTLLLSHYAFDLTSNKVFSSLHLIESHTGILKGPYQWYTKYTDGKSLPMIPFTEGFMQIFGDSEHFRVWPHKAREIIKTIATQNNWTQLTTAAKYRTNLQTIPDPALRTLVLDTV